MAVVLVLTCVVQERFSAKRVLERSQQVPIAVKSPGRDELDRFPRTRDLDSARGFDALEGMNNDVEVTPIF